MTRWVCSNLSDSQPFLAFLSLGPGIHFATASLFFLCTGGDAERLGWKGCGLESGVKKLHLTH